MSFFKTTEQAWMDWQKDKNIPDTEEYGSAHDWAYHGFWAGAELGRRRFILLCISTAVNFILFATLVAL